MKRTIYCLVIFTVLIAGWWLLKLNAPMPQKQTLLNTIHTNATVTTKSSATNSKPVITLPATEATNDFADAARKYNQGLINKGELMVAAEKAANARPQDFYGKVIDQYGEPVVGATVRGSIMFEEGWNASRDEMHTTQTDSVGQFQFTGLHGSQLGVMPGKAGYELAPNTTAMTPPVSGKTSPNDRAVFTMWKLKGAEPMIQVEFDSRVPYDGTSATFDLLKGKKMASGDLRITLLRNPLQIQRGRDKFDWTVKIEMLGGGLLTENDLYPNWSPDSGYQSSFEASMSATDVPWNQDLNQSFYFKNAQGQYGRLFIGLSTDSMRPDTGITIQAWINPSGSQNLEFDPQKQIRYSN